MCYSSEVKTPTVSQRCQFEPTRKQMGQIIEQVSLVVITTSLYGENRHKTLVGFHPIYDTHPTQVVKFELEIVYDIWHKLYIYFPIGL
jgi:hypothetical protein